MAHNYSITFISLRAGTTYTVNIGGGTGDAIPLLPGSQPFTTQEDANEDQFIPIRTQSGYIRIVDDGKDANGNAFDWKDLLPQTDTERPVTLTDNNGNIVWQGFMQAQTFSGVLYGNPQQREFPIQCPLTILKGVQASTTETQLHNFAYLLKVIIDSIPTLSITNIYVQGGADAQSWLLKIFDWQNFLNMSDDEDDTARYNYNGILEDMCKFWGWTARIYRQSIYLTCADDQAEQSWLSMTYEQLTTMAGGTAAGSTNGTFDTMTLTGDIYASVNNDDVAQRGYHKATVKADVNMEERVIDFAPASVRKTMDANGYTWTQGEDDYTGYFSTTPIYQFTSKSLAGEATQYSGFVRRQVFSSTEATDPTKADMILMTRTGNTNVQASLQVMRAMSYSGGSLSFGGTIYTGEKPFEKGDKWPKTLVVRIGIGMTRVTAKWWYLNDRLENNVPVYDHGWSSTPQSCQLYLAGSQINGAISPLGVLWVTNENASAIFRSIPVEEGLYGYIFIDFMGMDGLGDMTNVFQIGNFEVRFSRDETILPSSWNDKRPRTMSVERNKTMEYTSENNSPVPDEWNADCIFASDNNMEYGYGLLMNPNGRYMETAQYGNTAAHPEQHLADRVTAFWTTAKRRFMTELRSDAITEPTPKYKVTLDSIQCHPISISHEWRDDVTTITLLEMPTS